MRDITPEERKILKPHFEEIADMYLALGECKNTGEFKEKLLELADLGSTNEVANRIYVSLLGEN